MENYSGIIALILYILGLIVFLRYEAKHENEPEQEAKTHKQETIRACPLDLDDEDATIACLIASIECRNEYKKNVQVISVRKVG